MKRKQYLVTSTVGHNFIKSAWNSSIRAIEQAAKALANEVGADYHLTDSSSVKEGFEHVAGQRTWTNQKNGCAVVFTIKKLKEVTK